MFQALRLFWNIYEAYICRIDVVKNKSIILCINELIQLGVTSCKAIKLWYLIQLEQYFTHAYMINDETKF